MFEKNVWFKRFIFYSNPINFNLFLEKIKIIFLMYYFKFLNKFSNSVGINKKSKNRIVISLTTHPKRFDYVYLTLESLLNQKVKPEKIVLWLSKKETLNNYVPKKILKLKKRGLTIKFVDENFKAYNKLIFSLKDYKNKLILTVDDDIIYPNDFISKIYKKHLKNKKSIIAYRCHEIKKINSRQLVPYNSWKAATKNTPSNNLFFTGVGGVLYPPNALHKEVFNKKVFTKLSPLADDIWFNAMSLLNKTKVILVENKSINFPIVLNSQESALWHKNVKENENDKQLKKVFDYYKLYDSID